MTTWGDEPETFPYHCPQCSQAVLMEVLARWHNVPEGGDEWEPHQWTSARCRSCKSPVLLYQEADYGPGDWSQYTQTYPEADRQLPWSVPQAIRDDFAEAQRCMRALCYTAGAIMARRVVDGIRKEHGYTRGNLNDGLKAMKDAGVIDSRLYQWADTAREVGNEGAHDTDSRVSREDADEVLRFVEALVDYLYVFQKAYADFQRRRKILKEGGDPDALPSFVKANPSKADEKPSTDV